MQYIISPDKDGIQFDAYIAALSTYSHRLPAEVSSFAGDSDRFILTHPSSLHDCWLEELSISEARSSGAVGSGVSVKLKLLGQMHDRYIILKYDRVAEYSIAGAKAEFNSFHGDLYTHEVRVNESDQVIHEILFESGNVIEIQCETFSVEEQLISSEN